MFPELRRSCISVKAVEVLSLRFRIEQIVSRSLNSLTMHSTQLVDIVRWGGGSILRGREKH